MAKSFSNTNGKAASGAGYYKFKDGDNVVRLVGGILPRYQYWIRDPDLKVDCLHFNPDTETFDRAEPDYVNDYFPDAKCAWSYVSLCIDPTDGKVKIFPHKKKLYMQIQEAASDLGDPTDPDTGYDLVITRTKTGSAAFNVDYSLRVLKLKRRPLTAEERAAVEASPTIDTLCPRPTPDAVRKACEAAKNKDTANHSNADHEAASEASGTDDIPF